MGWATDPSLAVPRSHFLYSFSHSMRGLPLFCSLARECDKQTMRRIKDKRRREKKDGFSYCIIAGGDAPVTDLQDPSVFVLQIALLIGREVILDGKDGTHLLDAFVLHFVA